ncbi:hypothetical protein, partial [Leuconostoc gasicomitatum]|uniref:hypothetical protein n=1 Tax=Leuconostoc gasicomitatum TaxID=115778 RepID=UPI001CC63EDD
QVFVHGRSIETRPESVKARQTFGHLDFMYFIMKYLQKSTESHYKRTISNFFAFSLRTCK